MPYTVLKDFTFAAAHRIPGHTGGCENLHGHNYRVRLVVAADELDELGMVVDFADLKAALEEAAGRYDHRVLNEIPPFDEKSPTAEILAEHLFGALSRRLDGLGRGVRVRRVEVWENDSSCAWYEP